MSDKAIRLQQVADQRLLHDFAAGGALQVIGAELIVIDLDILIVDAGAVQAGNRLAFQFIQAVERYLHLPLRAGAEIASQRLCNVLPAGETGLVKAVEIELKAFRLHQIEAGIGQLDVADSYLRQTFAVQPESSYSVQISAP